MVKIAYNTKQIVPSDSGIDYCPAPEKARDRQISSRGKSVTIFPEAKPFRNGKVSAVIGPFACNECVLKCKDAYIVISEARLPFVEILVDREYLDETEEPVTIPLIEEYVDVGAVDDEGEYLLDSLIELVNADSLSLGSDGTVEVNGNQ